MNKVNAFGAICGYELFFKANFVNKITNVEEKPIKSGKFNNVKI
jgi:hypothetical protein